MNKPAAQENFSIDTLFNQSLINQKLYTDPDLFKLEQQQLFGRAWLLLGHESQIDSPGCYFIGHMGLVSVIVVRDRDNRIQVLENRCAHRGPAVCTEPRGRKNVFNCPYHGWSYKLNGDLNSIPMMEDYAEDFPKQQRGLRKVPRVVTYRGFIFASLAEQGPGLEEFLGAAKVAFDDFMDRAPEGEIELVGEPLKFRFRGNWKIIFENLGDTLHPYYAHASAVMAMQSVDSANGADNADDGGKDREESKDKNLDLGSGIPQLLSGAQTLECTTTEYGHSFMTGLGQLIGANAAADKELLKALKTKRGEQEARRIIDTDVYVTMVYPSVLVKPGSQNIRIIRPLSHDETEVTMYLFQLKGAPEQVLEAGYEYYRELGSPAAPVLVDDLHIYELMQADYGRNYWLSAERGLAQAQPEHSVAPGESGTSEEYIRNQYQVWRRYMTESDTA